MSMRTRTLKLHSAFLPGEMEGSDWRNFFEFWLAANDRLRALEQKDLQQRKARAVKLLRLRDKADPILTKALRDEIPIVAAVKKIKRLSPDRVMLREWFDIWEKAAKATPEELAKQNEDIARRQRELARAEKFHKASKAITGGLITLAEATEAGDLEAAKALVKAAVQITGIVTIAEKRHPEMMRTVAKTNDLWPILTDGEPGWEREAVRRCRELALGEETQSFKTRFRQARGADANLPARQWAKTAVRTIEGTQLRCASIGGFMREFGSREVFLTFLRKAGWQLGMLPKWTEPVLNLTDFCVASLPEWKRVVRKMIREEVPDFQMRPEWATQRNSAAHRGRDTPGELQNAILDDICSALERIAPANELPKSTC